ncbi:hypothetical protein [Streptomyces murinus]|uniref:hypothetical protein n=1 Tax=Streptomyces murinus TaxID=33900 RepID=UPI001F1D1550|nr:hypothetical protein [Streptomyces murinus]
MGHIKVGDFEEDFSMNLSYWNVGQYEASWIRALQVLELADDAVSCLISSITDPVNSNFIFCWPLYRSGDVVHVQNSIIFLEDIAEDFNPNEPWRHVEPRSTVDEDGHDISEWETTVDEVGDFLQTLRSS